LGQHFLASQPAAIRIVEALGDLSQSTILEIGPGRGALTSLLAASGRRLIAVELDRVMAAQLRMKFSTEPYVEIIEGDILKIELDNVWAEARHVRPGLNSAPEPVSVVGNLPYYITSDILLRLLEYHRYFSIIVIMVQKKWQTIGGFAGCRDYGLLATAPLYARVENCLRFRPRHQSAASTPHGGALDD
jgi:16S rRNA (adenine1518-N6/adenine1519-N6)-dimethyltransferase